MDSVAKAALELTGQPKMTKLMPQLPENWSDFQ